jgi:hypothetical protein
VNGERTLTREEARAFLSAKGSRRKAPHSFTRRILHWPYCARCGLVLLKNDASRRAASVPCTWEE